MLDIPISIPTMEIAVPAIVLFVVQLLKQFKALQNDKVKKLLPTIAGLIGAPAAIGYQLILVGLLPSGEAIAQLAVYGFTLGLTACGAFSFCKGLFSGKTKNDIPH